jgi:hypothetical protein
MYSPPTPAVCYCHSVLSNVASVAFMTVYFISNAASAAFMTAYIISNTRYPASGVLMENGCAKWGWQN